MSEREPWFADPMYAEEACRYCDGDGCDACNDTGLAYTDDAIRRQVEAAEKAENSHSETT